MGPESGDSTVITDRGGEAESGRGATGDAATGSQALSPSGSSVDRRAMDEAARLIESAARGLHEAHERGLVHRDIKPGNLIVTPDRGLVILDFGLARDVSSDAPGLTMTGDLVGTPAYLSPEQLSAGKIRVDRRSDVFSLGVTLFECLALKRPFEGPTLQGLFREIESSEAPDLRRLNRRIPADLAVIVDHALAKHPDQRYQTALDLAEDLRRFREREPIMARPIGPLTRSWRWAQRKPAMAGLVATFFLATLAISVITTLKNRELSRLNEDLERTVDVAEANARQARTNERRAEEESAAKTEALVREQDARRAESAALAEKTSALAEYERMADARRLADARAAADAMWPEHPDLVPALLAWQEKYAPLFARLAGHRVALAALRAKAVPYSDAAHARDFANELARVAMVERDLPRMRDGIPKLEDGELKRRGELTIANLETELAGLHEKVKGRRSWDFGDDIDLQFRHDALAKLVVDLEAFTAEGSGVVAGVARRLERSRRIRKETLEDRAELWSETIARIESNPRYDDLDLEPQLGLIPLGPDPVSGLEEFLDWRTQDWSDEGGALPERDASGRIAMTESRGLIFVLIPGGSFWMGAQRDPGKPNFDPRAEAEESPVRKLVLSPYLISKYEMTQGQWSRFDGANPSLYDPTWLKLKEGVKAGTPSYLCHPVEQVSWNDCALRLERLGLQLPTEAQWERAARADATPATPWAGTSEIGELGRFANLAGKELAGIDREAASAAHEDAFIVHAPVGSLAGNAFGLFDMTGNVREWCRESFAKYDVAPGAGDGMRRSASPLRILRDGAFGDRAARARIATRDSRDPTTRLAAIGLRPSRAVTGE